VSFFKALFGGSGVDLSSGRGEGAAEAGPSRGRRSRSSSLHGSDIVSELMESLQSVFGDGEKIELPVPPPCVSKSIEVLASELSDLVETLEGLGGACSLHASAIDSIVQQGHLTSYRRAKSTINLTALVEEFKNALEAVKAMKMAAPLTSCAYFEKFETRLTEAIADWNGLQSYDPAQDRGQSTISVTISGNREDAMAVRKKIEASIAQIRLEALIETGKKYGAEFIMAPCGHLMTKQPGQMPEHHDTSLQGEELKAKLTEFGITPRELNPEDFRELNPEDLMSGLPKGARVMMGTFDDLFSFLESQSPFGAKKDTNDDDEDDDDDDDDQDEDDDDDEDDDQDEEAPDGEDATLASNTGK